MFEAGKSYKTENGGVVVGPLVNAGSRYSHCSQKDVLGWWRKPPIWQFWKGRQYFLWCSCGEPEYYPTRPVYGRLIPNEPEKA